MSTNEQSPLPENSVNAHAMAVQSSALVEQQDMGWAAVPELAGPPRPSSPTLSIYLHALRRHWVMATALGLLCAAVAGPFVWFVLCPAEYKASAYLRIQASEPRIAFAPDERPTQASFDIYKGTQQQLMTSPFVLHAALRKPEVARLKCVVAEDDPIVWLEDELRVRYPGDAEIMEVSLRGDDRKEAATLVNAVVDTYIKEVADVERTVRTRRQDELERVHSEKTTEVRNERKELERLAGILGTADPEALALKQRIAVQEWSDYQRQLAQTTFLLNKAKSELAGQMKLLAAVDMRVITKPELDIAMRNDPVARRIAEELAYRQMDRASAEVVVRRGSTSRHAQRYVSDADSVQFQWDRLAEQFREEIHIMNRREVEEEVGRLEVEVAALTEQEGLLKTDVEKKKNDAQELGTSTVAFEMKRAELDNLQEVLKNIAEEREKIRVELRSASRVQIIQPAEEPQSQDNLTMRVSLTVLVVIVGLCLPVGCIAWWDTRAKRINSSEEVSKGLGLKVIGSVPMIPARVIRQLGSSSKQHRNWHLRLTESIDGIVARLLRKAELEQTRVILVSSASGGEGKTTLATQLAMSLARNGRNTVLVDFDLRQPAFDGVFGLPLAPGTSEVLRQQSDLSEAVRQTGTDNLSVVTAGRWDRHALKALANGAAGPIFQKLREEYEFVVIDASPILPVADTRFVSQHVDSVILSVFRDISRAPKIEAACEILEAFGVPKVEAVVTGRSEPLRDRDLGYESRLPTGDARAEQAG